MKPSFSFVTFFLFSLMMIITTTLFISIIIITPMFVSAQGIHKKQHPDYPRKTFHVSFKTDAKKPEILKSTTSSSSGSIDLSTSSSPLPPSSISRESIYHHNNHRQYYSYMLNNIHFDNDTVLYLEIDVENANITIINSTIPALVLNMHDPDTTTMHENRHEALTFFMQHNVKHARTENEHPRRRTFGQRILFKLVNTTVEYGMKFIGDSYLNGGSFQLIRYNGGPIFFPRFRSTQRHHSPLFSIKNSTIQYKQHATSNDEEDSHGVYADSDRLLPGSLVVFPIMTTCDSIIHDNESLREFIGVTIHLMNNRFIDGRVITLDDDDEHGQLGNLIVKNNIFLRATLSQLYAFNVSGVVEITGNRFYFGTVDVTHQGILLGVLVGSANIHLRVENNLIEASYPELGVPNSDAVTPLDQIAMRLSLGSTPRVDVHRNRIYLRRVGRFFQSAVEFRGGLHVEITDNEIYVHQKRLHNFLFDSRHNCRAYTDSYGFNFMDSEGHYGIGRHDLRHLLRRYVLFENNVINMHATRPSLPPRSKWKLTDPHDPLPIHDTTTTKEHRLKEAKKRKKKLEKFHNVHYTKIGWEVMVEWNELVRAAYHDPLYDDEGSHGEFYAFHWSTEVLVRAIISNNSFALTTSYTHMTPTLVDIEIPAIRKKVGGRSSLDIVSNRFLIRTNHSGTALRLHAAWNANEVVLRENEFWCETQGGDCLRLSGNAGEKHHNPNEDEDRIPPGDAKSEQEASIHATKPKVPGITFRRNKIRGYFHRQHFDHSSAIPLAVVGSQSAPHHTIFIQDNDIRARGAASLIKIQWARMVLENNFLKTIGHLGGGFYHLMHPKYVFLHHEQLERAPLFPSNWHELSDAFIEKQNQLQIGREDPDRRNHPDVLAEKKQEEEEEKEHNKYKQAFIEASVSHSKSLFMKHDDDDDKKTDDADVDQQQKPLKKLWTVSNEKVEVASGINSNDNIQDSSFISSSSSSSSSSKRKKSASKSKSNQEISRSKSESVALQQQQEEEEEKENNNDPRRGKEHILSPVFSTNLTFPKPWGGILHRNFSIQCVTMNGRALDYNEVKAFLPYQNMNRDELGKGQFRGVGESDDVVVFGCPDEGDDVPRMLGSFNEDL